MDLISIWALLSKARERKQFFDFFFSISVPAPSIS